MTEDSMVADLSPSSAGGWIRKAFASTTRVPRRILLAIEGWRERSRLRRELDILRQHGELDRTALPRSPAVAEALRAMEWRCGECADWRKCRTWLASGDAPGSYRALCPNAEALDELRCSETAASGSSLRNPCGILAELEAAKGIDGVRA